MQTLGKAASGSRKRYFATLFANLSTIVPLKKEWAVFFKKNQL